MVNIKKIAAASAAILSLTQPYSVTYAQDTGDMIACNKDENAASIEIHNPTDNILDANVFLKNNGSIKSKVSGRSHYHLSFSLENYPIHLRLKLDEKVYNYIVSKDCQILDQADKNVSVFKPQPDEDKINPDSISLNEMQKPSTIEYDFLNDTPWHDLGFNSTIYFDPNTHISRFISLQSFEVLSFNHSDYIYASIINNNASVSIDQN